MKQPSTDGFEPDAVFGGIDGEEAIRSIAISLKRIADSLAVCSAWGDEGLGGIAQAIRQTINQ